MMVRSNPRRRGNRDVVRGRVKKVTSPEVKNWEASIEQFFVYEYSRNKV